MINVAWSSGGLFNNTVCRGWRIRVWIFDDKRAEGEPLRTCFSFSFSFSHIHFSMFFFYICMYIVPARLIHWYRPRHCISNAMCIDRYCRLYNQIPRVFSSSLTIFSLGSRMRTSTFLLPPVRIRFTVGCRY